MKIKKFKLKDNITEKDLIALGFKNGGSWVKKDAELCLSVYFEYNDMFEYSIHIAFSSNINDWNDFDNILVLDEDFCQPYTPFYGDNYGKDVHDFPVLENVITRYNEVMSSLGIFEEIIEDNSETTYTANGKFYSDDKHCQYGEEHEEMDVDYPCNGCSQEDYCDSWDAQFCCMLCHYYGYPDCENCDPMDI